MAPGMASTHCMRLAGSFAGLEESSHEGQSVTHRAWAFGLLCSFKVLFVPRK